MSENIKICAQNPCQPEYSLCGDAEDAPETEDEVEPFRLARPGEIVTCDKCRAAIREIKQFNRWRQP